MAMRYANNGITVMPEIYSEFGHQVDKQQSLKLSTKNAEKWHTHISLTEQNSWIKL